MGVYVFCDNSNVFIEGKWAAARVENMKGPHPEFRIDYGQVLTVCSEGRPVLSANMYGSRPPANDSLWKKIEKDGWKINLLDRNPANKEKGLDIDIALDIHEVALSGAKPETIVLLAGDGDYQTLIPRVQARGWQFEIWFYSNIAGSLRVLADRFVNLEDHLGEIRFK